MSGGKEMSGNKERSGPSTYSEAGVDIHKAESFVSRLKLLARRDGHRRLWHGAGGYASVYPIFEHLAVALTTDGVGTKLLLAEEQGRYDTIGIDLVAMCANDLICVGARPAAFLDYYATGVLDEKVSDQLMSGIVAGCDDAGMLLVGGETAEMPDIYQRGQFDLAGFAMGTVTREALITGENLENGDILIGVASSGIHSNGLSLARKLVAADSPMRTSLLEPTLIYARPVVRLLNEHPGWLKGVCHITGGGWTNILRANNKLRYEIDNHLPIPEVMRAIAEKVEPAEMYKTFNMGMGLCLMVAPDHCQHVLDVFEQCGFDARAIGSVSNRGSGLFIRGAMDDSFDLDIV